MNHSGGYRQTYSFALTCLVYHATTAFCRRNFDHRNDALGKTVGQMVGAARSARQNIVEGSSRAGLSSGQEIMQYDVAKGSLDELAGDYEAFVIDNGEPPWSETDPRAIEIAALKVDAFKAGPDAAHRYGVYILEMRRRFAKWIENEDPMISAQGILILVRRAAGMLVRQIASLKGESTEEAAPHCPLCGAAMVRRTARKGSNAGKSFWSCSRYPDCKGTVSIG